MTREEYEKLLQSDYWKGYSYSLIKELNFTCEDCGKSFYNERNKLQVHHLVYRDTNPWSYKPEELIVLCEECHKRRHGIMPKQDPMFDSTTTNDTGHYYDRSYHETNSAGSYDSIRDSYPIEPEHRFNYKYLLYGLLILIVLYFGPSILSNYISEKGKRAQEETIQQADEGIWDDIKPRTTRTSDEKRSEVRRDQTSNNESVRSGVLDDEETTFINQQKNDVSSLEESNEEIKSQPVETAKPNREMTNLEILEKRQYDRVVKQAQEAGVSSEGSTMEILDRIQHARVVKQAQEVGVSTEGSTMEILDRIQHARVVKQAQQLGVSTEGSTMEILDRISRKQMEKYNY